MSQNHADLAQHAALEAHLAHELLLNAAKALNMAGVNITASMDRTSPSYLAARADIDTAIGLVTGQALEALFRAKATLNQAATAAKAREEAEA